MAIGKAMSEIALKIVLQVLYTEPFATVGEVINNVMAISIRLFHILYAVLNISCVMLFTY